MWHKVVDFPKSVTIDVVVHWAYTESIVIYKSEQFSNLYSL